MRIRTKHWARPELTECDYFIKEPVLQKGSWQQVFAKKAPIHLDLGCGKCTFLAELAYRERNVNFIGVDISLDILGVARRNIEARFEDESAGNVALTCGNIEKIRDFISDEDGVERIYINFCNPWPSAGHHKRRLTHTRQLREYIKLIKKGGEIRFKTDDTLLYLSSLRYFKEAGLEIFFTSEDLNAAQGTGNIQSEHEVMFESRGIKTKAIWARV